MSGTILSSSSQFSAIYKTTIPPSTEGSGESNANEYEIKSTIKLSASGGSYFHYIWGTPNADQTSVSGSGAGQGTYYAVELRSPTFDNDGNCTATLDMWDNSAGGSTPTLLGSTGVPCSTTMQMRTVTFAYPASGITKIWTLIDNTLYSFTTSKTFGGQPGIGVVGAPNSSCGFSSVQFGPRSLVGPAALGPVNNLTTPTGVAVSASPNQLNIHIPQPSDPTGVGVILYLYSRNSNPWTVGGENSSGSSLGGDYTDTVGIQPATNYVYAQQERGFHGILSSQTSIYATTPPSGSVDPREVGVRANGSYWGAMGENIDTLSGNLNFSQPLLNAQGRNGRTVPFRLSYNSQNWRQDNQVNPNATYAWNLGEDVGYGYGWKLQLGSLTPYWKGYQNIDHYLFIDATGAEYHLTVNAGNVWSSTESIYVWFDATANLLHFRDGSSWLMGCLSGGLEPDLGTMYPTEINDTNGNQVLVRW